MNVFKLIIILLILNTCKISNSKESNEFLNYLNQSKNYNYFYKLIKKANYEKLFIEETEYKKVLYLPSNDSFKNLPLRMQKYIWSETDNSAAKKIIKTHLYTGSIKQAFKDPSQKVVVFDRIEVNGERVKIYRNNDLLVKDIVEKNKMIEKNNIQIIPVSCVMYLQPSASDNSLNKDEKKESLITSCCMLTNEEVDDFIKGSTI